MLESIAGLQKICAILLNNVAGLDRLFSAAPTRAGLAAKATRCIDEPLTMPLQFTIDPITLCPP